MDIMDIFRMNRTKTYAAHTHKHGQRICFGYHQYMHIKLFEKLHQHNETE